MELLRLVLAEQRGLGVQQRLVQVERQHSVPTERAGLPYLVLAEQPVQEAPLHRVQVELQHLVLAGQPEQAGLPLPVREAQKSPAPEAPQRQEQAELSAGLPRPAPEAPLHQARAE